VLVHGFGMSRQQVLPLIEPLHRHGWVVLALGMRGTGAERVGETFGLNESLDVKSAVELLRRRPYVDGTRIAIVGIGTGASAALLDADHDPALAALVLDAPQASGVEALNQHIIAQEPSLQWMLPLCRLAFTIGYGVDVDDLNLAEYGRVFAAQPTLLMHWPQDAEGDLPAQRVVQITEFLTTAIDRPRQQADADR
jgi:pimeloyl-ACP methyl ester carboxylesterase